MPLQLGVRSFLISPGQRENESNGDFFLLFFFSNHQLVGNSVGKEQKLGRKVQSKVTPRSGNKNIFAKEEGDTRWS